MTPEDRALLAELDLLVRIAEGGEEPPPDDPWADMLGDESPLVQWAACARAWLDGAFDAVRAAGLVGEERLAELRLLRERGDEPAPAELRARLTEARGWEEPPAEREPRPEPLLGVRAVLVGALAWHDDARVPSLTCYTGAVQVMWEQLRPVPADLRDPDAQPDVWIADDAGTEYLGGGGRSSGRRSADGRWLVDGDATFRPGVPVAARVLTVAIDGARIAFDVAGVAERPAV